MNELLKISNLTCGYGDNIIIRDFNLQVKDNDRLALVGPNGCGKSTILKSIYQICDIKSGDIFFKGHSLIGKSTEQMRKYGIAWFMQKNAVFSKLTVKENIKLALLNSEKNNKTKIADVLDQFENLKKWLNIPAGILSGGQRQQVSLAMLFAQDADLWLLDEPTAGLNDYNTECFIETILKISNSNNKIKTIIFVEHKKNVVDLLANKIINLNIK